MSRAKRKEPPRLRRVFVTRHYIAVTWFDIMSTSDDDARSKAVKVANEIKPDARAEATDNGWIADSATDIERVGQHSGDQTHKMLEVDDGVFVFKDSE